MNWLARLSLRKKLIIAFLLIGLVPAAIATALAWYKGRAIISDEVSQKIQTIRDLQEGQLHREISSMRASVQVEGRSDTTLLAAMDFASAVKKLPEQMASTVSESKAREYSQNFLKTTWAQAWRKLHGTDPAALSGLISAYDPMAAYLAYGYVGREAEDAKGNQGLEATDYGKAYETYHPYYAAFAKTMGYDDVLIYDVATGRVVYSVKKEIDLGMPLSSGPMAEAPLSHAVKLALASPGKSVMTDFMRSMQSMDAPVSYVATTISRAGQPVGVLLFEVSFNAFDQVINLENKWKGRGLGDSGEIFIIGKDKTLRSTIRTLIESKDAFLTRAKERGMDPAIVTYMTAMGTTATAMKLDSDLAVKALEGADAVLQTKDYDGIDVFAAVEPIFDNNNKDLGLEWFLVVKYDNEEAMAGMHTLEYLLFGLIGITAIVILFVAWSIGQSLSSSIARIASSIGEGSQAVADASQEIAAGATELSEAVTEQASSLQETSSAVHEISAMVNKSADNAQQSQTLSRGSLSKVQAGKVAIGEMLNAMSEIRESNDKIVAQVTQNSKEFDSVVQIISEIGSRTKVINDIVFQTKLLSFNASVEAARAGEHGKGFAVVAEEVGNLAQMSGNAAKEISSMLEESIKRVNGIASSSKTSIEQLIEAGKHSVQDGNDKAQHCNTVFDDIMRDTGSVTNIVEEIATGAREQAMGIQEVTKAMGQLDQVTQQNSSVAQQSSVAAERLSNQSQTLNDLVAALESLVHGAAKGQQVALKTVEVKPARREPLVADERPKKAVSQDKKQKSNNVVQLKRQVKATPAADTAQAKKAANGGQVPDSNDPRFEEV